MLRQRRTEVCEAAAFTFDQCAQSGLIVEPVFGIAKTLCPEFPKVRCSFHVAYIGYKEKEYKKIGNGEAKYVVLRRFKVHRVILGGSDGFYGIIEVGEFVGQSLLYRGHWLDFFKRPQQIVRPASQR